MRIVAGEWRGRRIVAPPGEVVRPSSERLREALFSMLLSRLGSLDGLHVADLYAGTGALGLEALSRGAAHATFVERDPLAFAALERNVASVGAAARSTLVRRAVELLPRAPLPHHLLFLDPPYAQGLAGPALAHLLAAGWVAGGAWLSVETERGVRIEQEQLRLEAVRDHGKARLHLLQAGE